MNFRTSWYLRTSAAGLALGLAAPAWAQQETPAQPNGQPAAETAGIGDIVVTAQKRSESVQRIPVTVQALSGETLARTGSKDLLQAVKSVPGVIFSRAPDDGLALTFRGLGTIARSQAFDLAQALFVDGVFMGKGRLYTTSFFDVNRMEFIKGTQSTLLGKNASLGAISVITKQPGDSFAFEGRAGAEVADGGYSLDAATDLPLSDQTSLRLAGHYNDLNGWVRNTANNHKGPEQRDLGLRGILRSRLSEDLTVTGSYQYARNEQRGASYSIISPTLPAEFGSGVLGGEVNQRMTASPTGDTYHDTKSHVGSVKAELALGEHTLVAQSSYVSYKLRMFDDFDFSKDDTVDFIRREKYHHFQQEVRLQSPGGRPLEYMAGVFYLSSHWESIEDQNFRVPAFPPPPNPVSGQLFNGTFRNNFNQDTKNISVFASGAYKITPGLRLAGGIRWTHEKKDVIFGRIVTSAPTIWNTIANPPFDPTPLALSNNFLDGNVSLQYDVTPDVMAFASFGHGSKSGGFAETNTIAIPPPLLVGGKVPAALVRAGSQIDNEYAKTYEVGIKSTLFNRRLRFNLTGFWTDVAGFQDTVFTGGPLGFITANGPARSKGFEVESNFQVTPEFQFGGSFTYSDAVGTIQPIDAATSAPKVDAQGAPVYQAFRRTQAPKVILNLNASYERDLSDALSIHANAALRHRSSMFNQRQEQFLSRELTTVDLSAGFSGRNDRWGIDLLVKNAFDKISEDFASPTIDPRFAAFYGAYMASPTQHRTIMVSVHFKY
ncbi:TonB-dependent receptor [Novosphingobium sp. PASSN1]|uniref:TonB-dependent receptor n=1 Tax=Novosphingobium sp. PASSN1 TaxID=2015561 RepID=UPI000BCBC33A|nr:TonB-dependent receptor [Novosphingobium sp. PASSN1]OYU34510.1 MAG: hypothetical protein CFE35_14010 [Novosphingobium sp. PASSN1]